MIKEFPESRSIPSEICLIQGCVLSPLLFNIYIDEMKNIFTKDCDPVDLDGTLINHLLYADDLIVISNTSGGLKRSLKKNRRILFNMETDY